MYIMKVGVKVTCPLIRQHVLKNFNTTASEATCNLNYYDYTWFQSIWTCCSFTESAVKVENTVGNQAFL